MELFDIRSFAAFSSTVLSLRKDIYHRTQPRIVHYNDVSARNRLTSMVRPIPTEIIC
jgi:hypothetical protein